MAEKVPPEVQNKLLRLQQLQEQLRLILAQKQSAEMELREVNKVLDEISKSPDDIVLYKSLGHVLLRSSKEELVKELNERKEVLELRVKTLERQEDYLQKQIEELRRKITEYLGKAYGVKSAG